MLLTVLLWIIAFLVYFSNRENVTNRWLAVSFAFVSLGSFKEYLYYDIWAMLPASVHTAPADKAALTAYSLVTAALYVFCNPFFFYSALHFADGIIKSEKLKARLRRFCFLPGIILLVFFPPIYFNEFQHSGRVFWYTFTIYNFAYVLVITWLLLKTVWMEKDPVRRRQKRFIPIIFLPPVWYLMFSIFVVHTLWIESLLKLWKGNVFLVAGSIIFYIILAFREGIMGIKLHGETYRWDSDMKTINRGARYTSHILKNEITKIEWSAINLEKNVSGDLETPNELAIIKRSVEHMKSFIEKTQLYSNDIKLNKKINNAFNIINECLLNTQSYLNKILCTVDCPKNADFYCDQHHVAEVLNNLLINAAEAMKNEGEIHIAFKYDEKKRMAVLSVKDTGMGIPEKDKRRLFEPYFTTKNTSTSFGLGLAYSANVVRKHGGYIKVDSTKSGSTFSLYFPQKGMGGLHE